MKNYKESQEGFVSIVIPALNEEEHIERCLTSICRLNAVKDTFEVILVDNGSTDNTIKSANLFRQEINIVIISAPKISIGAARNKGVKKSKGSILAFLDADCTVCKSWMEKALRYFDDEKVGAVGSSHVTPDASSWVTAAWDVHIGGKRIFGETDSLPSGNLWVRKIYYDTIGGFDESLITNEDYDLCYRLRKKGLTIISAPEVTAFHWGVPKSLKEYYRQQKWHGTYAVKVFLENVFEFRNIRPLVYGIYYGICMSGIILSLFSFRLMIGFLSAILIPGVALSLKSISREKSKRKHFAALAFLYIIYGVARAHSMASYVYMVIWSRIVTELPS